MVFYGLIESSGRMKDFYRVEYSNEAFSSSIFLKLVTTKNNNRGF